MKSAIVTKYRPNNLSLRLRGRSRKTNPPPSGYVRTRWLLFHPSIAELSYSTATWHHRLPNDVSLSFQIDNGVKSIDKLVTVFSHSLDANSRLERGESVPIRLCRPRCVHLYRQQCQSLSSSLPPPPFTDAPRGKSFQSISNSPTTKTRQRETAIAKGARIT